MISRVCRVHSAPEVHISPNRDQSNVHMPVMCPESEAHDILRIALCPMIASLPRAPIPQNSKPQWYPMKCNQNVSVSPSNSTLSSIHL